MFYPSFSSFNVPKKPSLKNQLWKQNIFFKQTLSPILHNVQIWATCILRNSQGEMLMAPRAAVSVANSLRRDILSPKPILNTQFPIPAPRAQSFIKEESKTTQQPLDSRQHSRESQPLPKPPSPKKTCHPRAYSAPTISRATPQLPSQLSPVLGIPGAAQPRDGRGRGNLASRPAEDTHRLPALCRCLAG